MIQQASDLSWLAQVVVPGSATAAVITVVILFLRYLSQERAAAAAERKTAQEAFDASLAATRQHYGEVLATARTQLIAQIDSTRNQFLQQLEAFDRTHLQRLDGVADRFADAIERNEQATRDLANELRQFGRQVPVSVRTPQG